ncbi:BTB/POZ domain-containing protein 2-like isoform X2 [Paramacrobiotus metropolitanus]|uniref:BTB/POZ domain-containing protein 2-like isoform X2 n=1 Tax=Paramacrobiotus metropolitanus TaxID=2943436 RepID=UPI002445B312|nr:BTB/POZ domain-containing protein 2-like isoform X2 [Paramacrobiotus metropolitanus]
MDNVTPENCFSWYLQAKCPRFAVSNLADFFLGKIDPWGASVLQSDNFLEAHIDEVKSILSRDTLRAEENQVYTAVINWANRYCVKMAIRIEDAMTLRSELGNMLYLIRFPVMTYQEIAAGPSKSGILPAEEINQLFQFWFADEPLPIKFINRRRPLPTLLAISRFDKVKRPYYDGWSYIAGRPEAIKFVVSIGRKDGTSTAVQVPQSINLVAVAGFIQNQWPVDGSRCTASLRLSIDKTGSHYNSYNSFNDRYESTIDVHHESWTLTSDNISHPIHKFTLAKPVKLSLQNWYTIFLEIPGMTTSSYGFLRVHPGTAEPTIFPVNFRKFILR